MPIVCSDFDQVYQQSLRCISSSHCLCKTCPFPANGTQLWLQIKFAALLLLLSNYCGVVDFYHQFHKSSVRLLLT